MKTRWAVIKPPPQSHVEFAGQAARLAAVLTLLEVKCSCLVCLLFSHNLIKAMFAPPTSQPPLPCLWREGWVGVYSSDLNTYNWKPSEWWAAPGQSQDALMGAHGTEVWIGYTGGMQRRKGEWQVPNTVEKHHEHLALRSEFHPHLTSHSMFPSGCSCLSGRLVWGFLSWFSAHWKRQKET